MLSSKTSSVRSKDSVVFTRFASRLVGDTSSFMRRKHPDQKASESLMNYVRSWELLFQVWWSGRSSTLISFHLSHLKRLVRHYLFESALALMKTRLGPCSGSVLTKIDVEEVHLLRTTLRVICFAMLYHDISGVAHDHVIRWSVLWHGQHGQERIPWCPYMTISGTDSPSHTHSPTHTNPALWGQPYWYK